MMIKSPTQKGEYVAAISGSSDKYGNLLVELMNLTGAVNLQEVTLDQARAFCKAHGIRPQTEGATI